MGGLDGSADTLDCVYMDAGICVEVSATTTHEVIAMTAEEYLDLKNVRTDVERESSRGSKLVAKQDRVLHEKR